MKSVLLFFSILIKAESDFDFFRNGIFSNIFSPTHTHSAPRVGNLLSACPRFCCGSWLVPGENGWSACPLTILAEQLTPMCLLTSHCVTLAWQHHRVVRLQ
jgi:hypothetical protein